jgi:hypothetical protein
MVALAAAATTLIAVVSGLAVTGALQQFQRNHGPVLVLAFVLVLVAAGIWAYAAIRQQQSTHWTIAAVAVFLSGLLTGIVGMVVTQWDVKVPSVTASLDGNSVLTATATGYNLGTNDRLITRVALIEPKSMKLNGRLQTVYQIQPPMYSAVSGPDAGGTATQPLKVALTLPARTYGVVVESSVGGVPVCSPSGSISDAGPVANARTGCVIITLK